MMGVNAIYPANFELLCTREKKFVIKAQPRRIIYRRKK